MDHPPEGREHLSRLPQTYKEIPKEWQKWSRITELLNDSGKTTNITWAVGWFGTCQVKGRAISVEAARRLMDTGVTRRLPEFYEEMQRLQKVEEERKE